MATYNKLLEEDESGVDPSCASLYSINTQT